MHVPRLGSALTIVVTGLFAAACTEPPAETGGEIVTTVTEPPVGQLPAGVVPTHYALDLNVDPRETRFSGRVAISVEIAAPTERIWLHGLGLEVTEAYALDAAERRIEAVYAQALDSGVASLTLAEALPQGSATLHFAYSAPFNTSVNALFRAERGADAYAASQLEPVAGRQIFPGFDEPRFKTPFDVHITARADDRVITNSPEIDATELADGWVRHEFATTPPLPTYLLAFAVGPYDVVDAPAIPANSIRTEPLPFRGIAARNMGGRFGIALTDTPGLVAALEDYFGIPYPYAKLDLIAMPADFGGAMENVGAITYDERLILVGDDPPLQQRRVYMNVHAHELAHQWFGNLVTPDWWTDIWLNEAFASWMANKIAHAPWSSTRLLRRGEYASPCSATSKSTTRSTRSRTRRAAAFSRCSRTISARKLFGLVCAYTWSASRTASRTPISSSSRLPRARVSAASWSRFGRSSTSRACPSSRRGSNALRIPLLESSFGSAGTHRSGRRSMPMASNGRSRFASPTTRSMRPVACALS
jgi:hypothetical protein